MYFLIKMVIFHCYVSLPEGNFLNLKKVSSIIQGALPPNKRNTTPPEQLVFNTWIFAGARLLKDQNEQTRGTRDS